MKRKKNGYYRIRAAVLKAFSFVFKAVMAVFFLFPFYWMVTTAFKTYGESILFPPIDILYYLKNSVIVAVSVVVLQLFINIPAAYGFARYEFRGKRFFWALVMLAFMIPTQITFIPVYILFSKVRLLKTLWPQILPFAANAYGIFLMRQSFMQVPEELVEAARMDNAGEFTIMTRIVLPMSRSSILTAEMFSFISTWNSYFWPLVMTNSDKIRPVTLAMQRLQDANQGLEWPILMAANTLVVLPVLVLFLALSSQILKSLGYKGSK